VLSGGGEIPHVQQTPGAQCPGTHTFRYALYPHAGDWLEARVWRHALDYQVRLTAVQAGDLNRNRSIEHPSRTLPLTHSFASLSDDRLVPSALKREEKGDGLVLRFYNIAQEEVTAAVRLTGAKRGWRANLAEERLEELTLSGDTAQITARGAEIVTLIFEV
jgi:alpha-mannosidase